MAKSSKEKDLKEKQKAAKEAKKAADDAIKKAELLAEEVAKLESEIKTEKTSEESGSDSDSDSDSSSSSSSDSESEDGTPEKAVASKKVDSKSSATDSDSDSDGEAKKVEIKKETNDPSSSDDSSDDDSSDDDSSSEEEEGAKAEPAKSKSAGKEVDSSSNSSSDSSDSDSSGAKNGEKKSQNPIKMDVDQKSTDSDNSSSDSDSESDSDSTPASVPPVEESASNKRKADDEASNTPIKKQAVSSGEELNTKLFIRGLPWRATEEAVTAYFQACGSGPKSVELPLQDDGRSSGTAIVDFHDAASAEAALELNGADFEGRWLSIKYSTPKPILAPRQASEKQEGCKTVFVGNLSWDIDEDSLRAAFGDCGTISQIRFSTDRETGDFKGYGHIEFFETEATDAAVKLAGTEILGRAVRVDFANDRRQSFGGGGGRGGRGGGRGGGGGGRFGSGDRGRGQGRGGFGGRGGGRGGRGGGATTLHKKSGGIANFSGKKITFD